jgi:hypothetical protein
MWARSKVDSGMGSGPWSHRQGGVGRVGMGQVGMLRNGDGGVSRADPHQGGGDGRAWHTAFHSSYPAFYSNELLARTDTHLLAPCRAPIAACFLWASSAMACAAGTALC